MYTAQALTYFIALRSLTASLVPVGATAIEMRSSVKVKEGVDGERAKRFLASAERYCSTLQTLRNGVEVKTDFQLQ